MGLEDKSSSYLFWLSEYLARKLLVNIGPNAAVLLRFFEIGEMVNKGQVEDLEYQPAPGDIAAFIDSGAWKAHTPELARRFSSAFIDSLSGMQAEIDALAAYIPANEEEIRLAMRLGVDPLDAETIIDMYTSGRFPPVGMRQIFPDAARTFTDETMTALGSSGRQIRVGYSDMEIEDDVLQLQNVSINLAANMEDILTDIAALVCSGREEMSSRVGILWPWPDEGKPCPGYGPCADAKCQIDERYSLDAKVLRKAGAGGYAYSPRSDPARAVGLWLWDYARENACSVGAAVRAIKSKDFLTPLQFSDSPDRVFERLHARTKDCIEQSQVLSMR